MYVCWWHFAILEKDTDETRRITHNGQKYKMHIRSWKKNNAINCLNLKITKTEDFILENTIYKKQQRNNQCQMQNTLLL